MTKATNNQNQPQSAPKRGVLGSVATLMNRALSAASHKATVTLANHWRDNYNPLRGLTISRAVRMLEESDRGAHTQLQWAYEAIERQDPTLGALIEKRTSALQQLNWHIKIPDNLAEHQQALAERQAATLEAAYNQIKNLNQAIEALEMAAFRGYAHLELIRDRAGTINELAPIDQHYWVQPHRHGPWHYSPQATFGNTHGEPIEPHRLLIREVARPINRVALITFIRKSLSQKDWDGYVETYGIPPVFVIGPQGLTEDQAEDMVNLASSVSGGGGGYLPGGSDVKSLKAENGESGPFRAHIDYQDEQLVLRATGGLLTVLAMSGTGTLAGSAHQEAFDQIARAEAAQISELLNQQLSSQILNRSHPGEQHHAYWELAANEETDIGDYLRGIRTLKAAGHQVDPDQIQEKTGYQLTRPTQAAQQAQPKTPEPALTNREQQPNSSPAEPLQTADLALDPLQDHIENRLTRDWLDILSQNPPTNPTQPE